MPSWTASCRWSSAPPLRSIWRLARIAPARARASSRCVSPSRARPAIRTRSSCPARRSAPARWPSGSRSRSQPESLRDGLRTAAGAGRAGEQHSRSRVGLSSFTSVILALSTLQGPGTRLTYRIRVIEPAAVAPRVVASGAVSGPLDSDMRLILRTDTAEVEALFQVTAFGDTVTVGGEFLTRRMVGRSRRGLPLWEEDTYRRLVRMRWSDTARIHPFGTSLAPAVAPRALWVELILERHFAGGEGRATEQFELLDSTRNLSIEAVVRPRRARIILNLVRGDTVSGPRPMDIVLEEPPRVVQLVLKGRATTLVVSLTRPEPARSMRDRALALDAGIVCLRVSQPGVLQPFGTICGRLNNVARQLPLPTGDTLAATFAWPGPR